MGPSGPTVYGRIKVRGQVPWIGYLTFKYNGLLVPIYCIQVNWKNISHKVKLISNLCPRVMYQCYQTVEFFTGLNL